MIKIEESFKLQIDNKATINLAKNSTAHGKSKHIETKFQFLRDQVTKGKLEVVYFPTEEQVADVLTKAIRNLQFIKLRRELGVIAFDSLN